MVHGIKCHHPLEQFEIRKKPIHTKPEPQKSNACRTGYPPKRALAALSTGRSPVLQML